MRTGFAALAALALAGCSALGMPEHVNPANYDKVSAKIERGDDPHKRITKISAPLAYHKTGWMWPEYKLRASRNADGRLVTLQLYVIASFHEWAFLDRAWSHGQRLDLIEISREVRGCTAGSCAVSEHVAINITPEQLADYAQTGLSAKIEGNKGEVTIAVPPAYFRAFRDALHGTPAPAAVQ